MRGGGIFDAVVGEEREGGGHTPKFSPPRVAMDLIPSNGVKPRATLSYLFRITSS